MNKSVNIADFQGLRQIKPRDTHTNRSTKGHYDLHALESPSGFCQREAESWNQADEYHAPTVDIERAREPRRLGHRFGPSLVQRGAKILRFTRPTASHSAVTDQNRGVAWTGSFDDPFDAA